MRPPLKGALRMRLPPPVRETEQDMETGGEGGNSPVTPNEDDLLTGAGAADVEMGMASLHIDSPAKPRGDDDAAT